MITKVFVFILQHQKPLFFKNHAKFSALNRLKKNRGSNFSQATVMLLPVYLVKGYSAPQCTNAAIIC